MVVYYPLRELKDVLTQKVEYGLDSGSVSSATSNTLTDNTKDWGTDIWVDTYVEITDGTGKGQIRKISSNSSDTLTVSSNWTTTPDSTSKYRIFGAAGELSALLSILGQLDIKLTEHRDALKPDRGPLTQDLNSYSINPGESVNIDKSGLSGYSAIVAIVKATYDSSATAGVRVRYLYSPDGTNYDSPEDAEDAGNYEDLTFSAGATRQRTILVPIFTDNVRTQIVNLDSSYAVTVDVWTLLMR